MPESRLQFVLLKHSFPDSHDREDHFDLMLEDGDALATWQIQHWPPEQSQPAIPLPDHRRRYLDYEGPIEGNRGSVQRICKGKYRSLVRETGSWTIRLSGRSFTGIVRLEADPGIDTISQRWTLAVVSARLARKQSWDE